MCPVTTSVDKDESLRGIDQDGIAVWLSACCIGSRHQADAGGDVNRIGMRNARDQNPNGDKE